MATINDFKKDEKEFLEQISANTGKLSKSDDNECFVKSKCAIYLSRILGEWVTLNDDSMELLAWIIGDDVLGILKYLKSVAPVKIAKKIDAYCLDDCDSDYATIIIHFLQICSKNVYKKILIYCLKLLRKKAQAFNNGDAAAIARNMHAFKETFHATDSEAELCLLIFIVNTFKDPRSYFDNELDILDFQGRKYLSGVLDLNPRELDDALSGNLRKSGIIDYSGDSISFDDEYIKFFYNNSPDFVVKEFYSPVAEETVPLDYHILDARHTAHILNLLKDKPQKSMHILLYGPPGVGKTSFARGIAREIELPSYEIRRPDERNDVSRRRAALIACENLTTKGEQGSLIIVDEADSLLNTECSGFFSFFGKGSWGGRDKAWLNYYLEQPGVRAIWIVNNISEMDESVMRRFAFSAHFPHFSRQQRVQLWNTILQRRECKNLLTPEHIETLAMRHSVSAGAIDLAVEKARQVSADKSELFHSSVCLALEAHKTLLNGGIKKIDKDGIEKNYSLDGLNIAGDIDALMAQLTAYDRYLKELQNETRVSMNILFYGPPGTGKSELGRYIAERLGRELIVKRASDLLGCYLGESEQKIAAAFAAAESRGAVLIVDEADSFIFTRDIAQRSWETSMVNEFLTQMERFRGLLICTTNRFTGLDEASIRRFNQKIGFDFLTVKGMELFYEKFLVPLTGSPLDEAGRERLRNIRDLAPGDFKVVRDRYCLFTSNEVTHAMLIDALENEACIKNMSKNKKTLGFTA